MAAGNHMGMHVTQSTCGCSFLIRLYIGIFTEYGGSWKPAVKQTLCRWEIPFFNI